MNKSREGRQKNPHSNEGIGSGSAMTDSVTACDSFHQHGMGHGKKRCEIGGICSVPFTPGSVTMEDR
jgi:hypothetical protein